MGKYVKGVGRVYTGAWTRPERRKQIVDGKMACTACKQELPISSFPTSTITRYGYRSRCMRCAGLLQHYGINAVEYDAMLAAQGGVCAICAQSPEAGGKLMHVDHDHETGATRKLLCQGCNVGLGNFKDDPKVLRAAIEYLRRHGRE